MKKGDENQRVQKLVKINGIDKDNKKLLKENEMSSNEAE